METYKLDLNSKDIGELIAMIRVQRFQLNLQAFAKHFGLTERALELIEDGRGNSGVSLLKKIKEKYPKFIQFKLEVKLKK
jgi:hypothetical protein